MTMTYIFLFLFFFFSGVAGLGYEILWTRMLSVGLGHEIVSVLAVVAAFFSGLAIGAWTLDRPVSRSAKPEKWYAGLEAMIGIWALLLLLVIPYLNSHVAGLIGVTPSPLRHWLVSFFYPFALLLPATAAMGGTLPAMDRLLDRILGEHAMVAGLYGINTLGAVAGTFGVTFLLLPAVGTTMTTVSLAAINLIGSAGVLLLVRGRKPQRSSTIDREVPRGPGVNRFWLILPLTGALGIGFEVLMVRVFSQILENTVFSFAVMLMVFLLGTAAGAGIYQFAARRHHDTSFSIEKTENRLAVLLLTTAFTSISAIVLLGRAAAVFSWLQGFYGSGFWSSVAAEMTIALVFFFLPTAAMGATFSHLAQTLKRPDGGVGRALCLNTAGGAAAPLLFGVLLLPAVGITRSLLLIPGLYALCLPRFRRVHVLAVVLLATGIIWVALNTGPHPLVSVASGDRIVRHRQGVMASVSVIEDPQGGRHLKVNNRYQMGGTTSVFSDRRQAYLPLLLHAKPQRVLFLGLGSGVTFAAAGGFRDLQVDGVELIPEVIDVMDQFEKATGPLAEFKNLNIINADARRYVTATDRTYDVIIADLFHPARDGAGSLYTVEHFRAIRRRLADEGIFCQWLPLYQLDLATFKVIARTFMEVFPDAQAYLSHYSVEQPIIGLVGGRHPLRFPENWYRKRVQGKGFRNAMARFGYDGIYSLLGTFMADGGTLQEFSADSPLNTDANPIVSYRAPRFVYGPEEPAAKRLKTLLTAFSQPDPETILSPIITEEDYLARSRLPAYWAARNRFLEVGMQTEQSTDVRRLYATISDPLLSVVRMSIDFSAAYYPLVSIAYDIYPYDQDASYQLLRKLERANPLKREAGILRQRLFTDYKPPATSAVGTGG